MRALVLLLPLILGGCVSKVNYRAQADLSRCQAYLRYCQAAKGCLRVDTKSDDYDAREAALDAAHAVLRDHADNSEALKQ